MTHHILDDVLASFAAEPEQGREVLERYLRDYPEFAGDLVELSREMARMQLCDETELDAADTAAINKAWTLHVEARPLQDALSAISAELQRDLAKELNVSRQVISAFRERRVIASSIPRWFLKKFAELIDLTSEQLSNLLDTPDETQLMRSFRADRKPSPVSRVTFEQLLIDAGVSAEQLKSFKGRGD